MRRGRSRESLGPTIRAQQPEIRQDRRTVQGARHRNGHIGKDIPQENYSLRPRATDSAVKDSDAHWERADVGTALARTDKNCPTVKITEQT